MWRQSFRPLHQAEVCGHFRSTPRKRAPGSRPRRSSTLLFQLLSTSAQSYQLYRIYPKRMCSFLLSNWLPKNWLRMHIKLLGILLEATVENAVMQRNYLILSCAATKIKNTILIIKFEWNLSSNSTTCTRQKEIYRRQKVMHKHSKLLSVNCYFILRPNTQMVVHCVHKLFNTFLKADVLKWASKSGCALYSGHQLREKYGIYREDRVFWTSV